MLDKIDYHKAKDFFGKACDNGLQKGCDQYRELNENSSDKPLDNEDSVKTPLIIDVPDKL